MSFLFIDKSIIWEIIYAIIEYIKGNEEKSRHLRLLQRTRLAENG